MHILCGVKAALKQRDVGTNQKVTFEACVCVWVPGTRGSVSAVIYEAQRGIHHDVM